MSNFERGRTSAAALTMVSVVQRPQPFDHMTPDQKEVWTITTSTLPAEWFRPETLMLLELYCVHVCRAREITKRLKDRPDPFYIKEEREQSKIIMYLATKMRLTQQSTLDRSKSKRSKIGASPPWKDDD